MTDAEIVSVRYMVDDVAAQRRLLHVPLRLRDRHLESVRSPTSPAATCACSCQRPEQLSGPADARRRAAGPRRLEPHPPHRRRPRPPRSPASSAKGVTFRNDIVTGPGGAQILTVDPSGNLVELFQPADRTSAATYVTHPNREPDMLNERPHSSRSWPRSPSWAPITSAPPRRR